MTSIFLQAIYFVALCQFKRVNFQSVRGDVVEKAQAAETGIPLNWYSHLIFDLREAMTISGAQYSQSADKGEDDHLNWVQVITEQLRYCLKAAVNRHLDRSRCRNSIMTSLLQQMLPDEEKADFYKRIWRKIIGCIKDPTTCPKPCSAGHNPCLELATESTGKCIHITSNPNIHMLQSFQSFDLARSLVDYKCECGPGTFWNFVSKKCEKTQTCVEKLPCFAPNTLQCRETSKNDEGFECVCKELFEGPSCGSPRNICSSGSPCGAYGVCELLVNSTAYWPSTYQCRCLNGYSFDDTYGYETPNCDRPPYVYMDEDDMLDLLLVIVFMAILALCCVPLTILAQKCKKVKLKKAKKANKKERERNKEIGKMFSNMLPDFSSGKRETTRMKKQKTEAEDEEISPEVSSLSSDAMTSPIDLSLSPVTEEFSQPGRRRNAKYFDSRRTSTPKLDSDDTPELRSISLQTRRNPRKKRKRSPRKHRRSKSPDTSWSSVSSETFQRSRVAKPPKKLAQRKEKHKKTEWFDERNKSRSPQRTRMKGSPILKDRGRSKSPWSKHKKKNLNRMNKIVPKKRAAKSESPVHRREKIKMNRRRPKSESPSTSSRDQVSSLESWQAKKKEKSPGKIKVERRRKTPDSSVDSGSSSTEEPKTRRSKSLDMQEKRREVSRERKVGRDWRPKDLQNSDIIRERSKSPRSKHKKNNLNRMLKIIPKKRAAKSTSPIHKVGTAGKKRRRPKSESSSTSSRDQVSSLESWQRKKKGKSPGKKKVELRKKTPDTSDDSGSSTKETKMLRSKSLDMPGKSREVSRERKFARDWRPKKRDNLKKVYPLQRRQPWRW